MGQLHCLSALVISEVISSADLANFGGVMEITVAELVLSPLLRHRFAQALPCT